MIVVAQVAALVGALVHILAFTWETLLFRRKAIHEGLFQVPTEDVPPVLLWTFNVGFYNLFLGCGALSGIVAVQIGWTVAGWALITYTCSFMFLAGIALAVSDRMGLSRPKGAGMVGALSQSLPPLVALVGVATI